ncbi:polysaccharide pyruvyl transferase family protein [Paraliobacillus sediminis]|uniref:polysaccharide pyruvyl transferase family protein n=1 Tax=Paraliobacillus sediminis TaxID=1885916 RepID=UPI0013C2A72A|nr:polysaccharide pyruvyl transferase family protein [Paraliobacillus sediminis]
MMVQKILRYIVKKVKWHRNRLYIRISAKRTCERIKKSDKSRIILIDTPQHGNLGDQAITFAEIKFLEENCKAYNIFEIQISEIELSLKKLKRCLMESDVLMLQGGGNMGSEYLGEEEIRRKIISSFQKQKIILFPQTIHFENSAIGIRELEKTKVIYNLHKHLTLVAREKKSYGIMKNEFVNNNVILTPDIVLYLNQTKGSETRSNILFCFRNDVEGILDDTFKDTLIKMVTTYKNNVNFTDTVINKTIYKDNREEELEKIWSSFRKSKLVITDRLHGMVFAAITSTPCIAFGNYNHKVEGTYEWIKHLPYIRFIENKEDVTMHINELLDLNESELNYDNNFTSNYYNKILKTIFSEGIIKEKGIENIV